MDRIEKKYSIKF